MIFKFRGTILLDFLFSLFGRTGRAAINMLVLILLARIMKPADLGVYLLVFSVSLPLSLISLYGLPQSYIRLSAKSDDREIKKLTLLEVSALLAHFAVSAGLSLIALVLHQFSPWQLNILIFVLTLTWAFLAAQQFIFAEIFRVREAYFLSALFGGSLSPLLMLVALLAYPFFFPKETLGPVACVLGVTFALAFSNALALFFLLARVKPYFNFPEVKRLFLKQCIALYASGGPVLVAGLVTVFLPQVTMWLAGLLLGPEEVSNLGVALRLMFFVTLPLWVGNTVLPPTFAKLQTSNRSRDLQEMVSLVCGVLLLITIPTFIMLMIFPEEILSLLFGSHYSAAAGALRNLAIGYCAYAVLGTSITVLTYGKHRSYLIVISLFAVLMFMGTCLLLRGVLTVEFLAFALSLSFLTYGASAAYFCLRHERVNVLKISLSKLGLRMLVKKI
ncbi:oligosaccharide flippase family protein [Oxalobacteraceae bacterium R-40]|uniref:Oligosaccharide flippase family protein n=1 Tax=Keguizhuia sedimenti TaxID=3064264 RepID=A0ABU1BLM2_9BURK|nr:oligosaccharide flippase family protein [Oxalobacteraceae bacterium R-40]